MEVVGACATWHRHLVQGATPRAEPGLWARRRASPGASCSWRSEPDPAASSAGRAVPALGWDFQRSPAPALEARLEPAAMPALCSCVGTPLAMQACVTAWDPRLACLALSLGGQLRAEASCLLRARSRQGAGLAPLSGEQFKNCWKASIEGKKKGVSENLFSQAGFPGTGTGAGQIPALPWSLPHARQAGTGREQSGAGSRQSCGISVGGCAAPPRGTGNGGPTGQPGSATSCKCFLELSILPAAKAEEEKGPSEELAHLELFPLLPTHCLSCLHYPAWSHPPCSCPPA